MRHRFATIEHYLPNDDQVTMDITFTVSGEMEGTYFEPPDPGYISNVKIKVDGQPYTLNENDFNSLLDDLWEWV